MIHEITAFLKPEYHTEFGTEHTVLYETDGRNTVQDGIDTIIHNGLNLTINREVIRVPPSAIYKITSRCT